MKMRFRLTPKAKADLRAIGRYTLNIWGKTKRNDYLLSLGERFEWLSHNPMLGKFRPELGENYVSYQHESHIVFYFIQGEIIEIFSILHKSMDFPSRFE